MARHRAPDAVEDDPAADPRAAPPAPPAPPGSNGRTGPFPTTELRRTSPAGPGGAGGGPPPAGPAHRTGPGGPGWPAAVPAGDRGGTPPPGQLDDSTGTFTRVLLSGLGGEVEVETPTAPPPGPRTEPATVTGRAASAVERGGVRAIEGTRRVAGRIAALRGDERTALVAVCGVLGVVLVAIVALLLVVRFTIGDPAPTAAPKPSAAAAGRTAPVASATAAPTTEPTPSGSPPPPAGGEFAGKHSGYCLAAPANRTDDGAQLVQRPCGVGPDTGFHLLLKPGRTDAYSLIDARTGRCVDVLGSSTGDGAPVVQWECVGAENQTFELRPVPESDYVQIVAGHSGKCLDVAGVSRDENAPIQQWACHDAPTEAQMGNQSFKLTPG